jgi:hypothetical protein
MFKYVLAAVLIIVCLVFLQKGCERMRNARWDRWDRKKDERQQNRDERKQDRFWNRDDGEDKHTMPDREKRFIWRRRETE